MISSDSTDTLHLREVCADDLPALVEMLADPRQVRFIEFEATESSARALLDWSLRTAQEAPRTAYSFALTLAGEDRAIGVCSLVLRDPPPSTGNLGILLQRRVQGKGIALAASQLLFRFGLEQRHLHRLTAGCAEENKASVRLLERAGMRREAHLRESHWQKGRWNDWFLYALLEHEWKAR